MSNERKLVDYLNEKYSSIGFDLTDEHKMLIETGVAFGIEFSMKILGGINIKDILGQYDAE